MEKQLAELTDRLKKAAGANLRAVVLYGSAASGHFHKKHSDLNVLCILDRMDPAALAALQPAVEWWVGKDQPLPLVFTSEELERSADVFAIELLDIKSHHRMLFGDDCFAALDVPMERHRVELEHELRSRLVRFRQAYLVAAGKRRPLLQLMTKALSSFLTLFRHALLVLGEPPPADHHAMLDRLAGLLSVDLAPFHAVLEVREGKRDSSSLDPEDVACGFLDGVARVVDAVDRLPAPGAGA